MTHTLTDHTLTDHTLILSAYRPVHLVLIAVALVVLVVIGGQVLGLARRNRATNTGTRARRHPAAGRDDSEPRDTVPLVPGSSCGRRA